MKRIPTNGKESTFDGYFAAIILWLIIIAMQQCESNTHMEAITHEVMMLKYK